MGDAGVVAAEPVAGVEAVHRHEVAGGLEVQRTAAERIDYRNGDRRQTALTGRTAADADRTARQTLRGRRHSGHRGTGFEGTAGRVVAWAGDSPPARSRSPSRGARPLDSGAANYYVVKPF